MQDLNVEYIKSFASSVQKLYTVFFKRFPFLKTMIINAVIYGSNNFVLIIKSGSDKYHTFSLYGSSEGYLVKSGYDRSINVRFTMDKHTVDDLIHRRAVYEKKPVKLLKYIPAFFASMAINDKRLYYHELKGQRISLRPGNDSDIPYLIKWYNDYELNRLAGWSSTQATEERLKYSMSKSFGDDPMNLMIDNEQGEPIGTIQLYDINEKDKNCLLGIRIGNRQHMNQGYGTDAVNTILEYAFMKMDMYRVTLKVYEYNDRARCCYLKCGFKCEGKTRKSALIDGQYYDEIVMGILKSEFIEKNRNEVK